MDIYIYIYKDNTNRVLISTPGTSRLAPSHRVSRGGRGDKDSDGERRLNMCTGLYRWYKNRPHIETSRLTAHVYK